MGSGGSRDVTNGVQKGSPSDKKGKTSQEHKIFQEVKEDILNDLEPDDVLDQLRESGSVSEDDYRRITSGGTRRQKSERLYDSLGKRLPESFHALVIALQRTNNKHLLDKVDRRSTWYYPKIDADAMKQKPLPEIKTACTGVEGKRAGKPSELLLELTVRAQKTEVEFDKMIKVLEDPLIKCRVNDKLIKSSLCLIAQVDTSPLTVHLKPLGKFRMQAFESKADECVKLLVVEVLEKNPKSHEQFEPGEVLDVKYGLRCQYTDEEEKPASESAVSELKRNTELLTEELEATNYLNTLEFFTNKERDEIKALLRRRERVGRLLDTIVQKGEGGAEEFITVLLQDPIFGPLGQNNISHVPGIKSMHTLVDKYEVLVDQMLPEAVVQACIEENVLPEVFTHSVVWKKARGDRSLRTMMILHAVMLESVEKANKFCEILKKQGYALSSGVPGSKNAK